MKQVRSMTKHEELIISSMEGKPFTENAKPISWEGFIKHVPISLLKELFPEYSWKYGPHPVKVNMGDDFTIQFYRSKLEGRKCYLILKRHTLHIFTEEV